MATSNTSPPPTFASNGEAALHWLNFGFDVIPLVAGSKQPAVAWDGWFRELTPETVAAYWQKHPNANIAFLVGPHLLVLDADTPEADAALCRIERDHSCPPVMRVKTARGWHHYFRLQAGTYARTDTHSTTEHPERIDVKTGRTLVTLPPSTGKTLESSVSDMGEIFVADQPFVDAIYTHNGRQPPRPKAAIVRCDAEDRPISVTTHAQLSALLEHVDPNAGYADWCNVLMAVHHATNGSDEGFALVVTWSSKGKSYPGTAALREKWRSFDDHAGKPITIGTLIWMASESGADIESILAGEDFEVCETEVVQSHASEITKNELAKAHESKVVSVGCRANPLDAFSLLGRSSDLEKHVTDEVHILGQLAVMGQATVLFAAPNTGKTVLTLNLLIEAIKAGFVDASKTYYLNMDDSAKGLLEKNQIAEEYGFHMLAEGHRNFSARDFVGIMRQMIENDQARGVVIILDTLKKFVDLMDKGRTSAFTNVIRPFVMKGGTVIALAHTNKKPGLDGKPVYGGVSDILNDVDCAYTIAPVSAEDGKKVFEFNCIKSRGGAISTAAYSYAIGNGLSYGEVLLSVQPVDPNEIAALRQSESIKSDSELIAAITACITDGINTKMRIAETTAERSGISKRAAVKVLEAYTGNDPTLHRWSYEVRDRGAKVFALLPSPNP